MILVIIVALLSASPSVQAVPPSETAASDQSPAAGGPTVSLRDNCPKNPHGQGPFPFTSRMGSAKSCAH